MKKKKKTTAKNENKSHKNKLFNVGDKSIINNIDTKFKNHTPGTVQYGIGRKLVQVKRELGLYSDTETMRYCVNKVWQTIFQKENKK